jgi:lysozyme
MRRITPIFSLAIAACASSPDTGTDSESSVMVCAAGPTVKGVDVSAEVVNWQTFAAGGWDFGIAKASEGVTFVESQFAVNWPQMKAAGVVRGAYCFFHPRPDDPAQEADFFVQTVNKAGGFEPGDFAALDLETLDNATAAQVAADALTFLQRVKADTGITPIIYTSPRVFDTLLGSPTGFDGYPLWDVTWNGGPPKCPNIPASWPNWAFWQYAGDSITAPGLPGAMNDGDVFNGTRADLVSLGMSLGAQPTPDAGVPQDAGPDAGVADGDANLGNPENGAVTAGCCNADGANADRPWFTLILVLACAALCRSKARRSS